MEKQVYKEDLWEDLNALAEKHAPNLPPNDWGDVVLQYTMHLLFHHAPSVEDATDLATEAICEAVKQHFINHMLERRTDD